MFLKTHRRTKHGKSYCYYRIAENKRTVRGVVQRQVLYPGEINDSQREAWERAIRVFDEDAGGERDLTLFASTTEVPAHAQGHGVQVRLDAMQLHRPRQWGACWLAAQLWNELQLDGFWRPLLGTSREGTDWTKVLQVLTIYRLLDPGSEWRLHRDWFQNTALADLLDSDFSLAAKDTLYRCHDLLVPHKDALFTHLHNRWRDLFNPDYEVLLYDLTSTYFESTPDFPEGDKRRFGYSRDSRPKGDSQPTGCPQGEQSEATAATASRSSSPWSSPPKAFPSPIKSCPETRSTTRLCAPSSPISNRNMAKRNASGSWTGASPPRKS